MELNNKLDSSFYMEIKEKIKDYLPESEEYGTPELKEIMGRVTLVIDDKMVDVESYNDCYSEYCSAHGEILMERASVEWDEDKGSLYYDYGEHGTEMTDLILPEIADRLQDSKYQELQRKFVDYEQVKENIVIALVSSADKEYPCQDAGIGGKVAVYKIHSYEELRPISAYNRYSFDVTRDMLEAYGITQEQLHQLALQNTQRMYPPQLKGIAELTEGGLPEEMECIYILTDGNEGRTALLNQTFMDQVTERLGDVYVIEDYPRVILVPTDKMVSQLDAELFHLRASIPACKVSMKKYFIADNFAEMHKLEEFISLMEGSTILGTRLGSESAEELLSKAYVFKRNQLQQEESKHLTPEKPRKRSRSI